MLLADELGGLEALARRPSQVFASDPDSRPGVPIRKTPLRLNKPGGVTPMKPDGSDTHSPVEQSKIASEFIIVR